MRVIVTGGAGFLGSHLCERLIDRGDEVVCVDNFITGSVENLAHVPGRPGFSLLCQDVSVSVEVPGTVDSIFHLASLASPRAYLRHPIETLTVGSLGTRNCLELARAKRARFVLASTSEVYGNPQVHPQTENYWGHVNPIGFRSVYDEAKRFSESMTMAYHRTFGLDVRIARIFNTYGPRLRPGDGRVVSSLLAQALEGRPLTVYGDGTQTRSFCYVDDEVRAILALERSSATGPVNIGNPAEITLLGLADQVLAVTGSSSPIVFKPLPQDDPVRRRPDITLARTLLHWEPTVDLAEGLYRTRDWLARELGQVASGFRCRSDGRGSDFMVILGDGTDILGAVAGLAGGDGAWSQLGGRVRDVPPPRRKRAFRPHPRRLLAVDRTPVESLAHRRLRRGHHDPGEIQVLGHDDLVEQGG
jgi:nucleoside-diphosphate-sugar epimerase